MATRAEVYTDRLQKIEQMRLARATFTEIAALEGVSKERVRQLFNQAMRFRRRTEEYHEEVKQKAAQAHRSLAEAVPLWPEATQWFFLAQPINLALLLHISTLPVATKESNGNMES